MKKFREYVAETSKHKMLSAQQRRVDVMSEPDEDEGPYTPQYHPDHPKHVNIVKLALQQHGKEFAKKVHKVKNGRSEYYDKKLYTGKKSEEVKEVNMRPPSTRLLKTPTSRALKADPDLAKHYQNNRSAYEHPSAVIDREIARERLGVGNMKRLRDRRRNAEAPK